MLLSGAGRGAGGPKWRRLPQKELRAARATGRCGARVLSKRKAQLPRSDGVLVAGVDAWDELGLRRQLGATRDA